MLRAARLLRFAWVGGSMIKRLSVLVYAPVDELLGIVGLINYFIAKESILVVNVNGDPEFTASTLSLFVRRVPFNGTDVFAVII